MIISKEKFCSELKNYFKSRNLTQAEIAHKLGVTVVAVNMLLNGRRNFGKITANKWAEAFGLNAMWLLTGEGNMTHEQGNASRVTPNVYYAPLITRYAYAGYLRGYGDSEYIDNMPIYPFLVDHDPHGQYYAIEVKGDSMDDGSDRSIKDGAVALCRVVPRELWHDNTLHVNKWIFVIVTDDGILIKRIKKHDLTDGTITLSSLNTIYPDITVSLNDVNIIMNVVQVSHAPVL